MKELTGRSDVLQSHRRSAWIRITRNQQFNRFVRRGSKKNLFTLTIEKGQWDRAREIVARFQFTGIRRSHRTNCRLERERMSLIFRREGTHSNQERVDLRRAEDPTRWQTHSNIVHRFDVFVGWRAKRRRLDREEDRWGIHLPLLNTIEMNSYGLSEQLFIWVHRSNRRNCCDVCHSTIEVECNHQRCYRWILGHQQRWQLWLTIWQLNELRTTLDSCKEMASSVDISRTLVLVVTYEWVERTARWVNHVKYYIDLICPMQCYWFWSRIREGC